jgi:hypothetical protein
MWKNIEIRRMRRYMTTQTITAEEVQRAIYFDVEGQGDSINDEKRDPILGGVLVDGSYEITLFGDDLEVAARAKKWNHQPLKQFLEDLSNRARLEGRKLVYFTSAEEKLFSQFEVDIEDVGFDLRPLADKNKDYIKCRKAFRSNVRKFKSRNTVKTTKMKIRTKVFGLLTLFAAEKGLSRPHSYSAGNIGNYCKKIKDQARVKETYEAWSEGTKKNLALVKNHNEHDCNATRFVMGLLVNS